jgi:hypothetical protein
MSHQFDSTRTGPPLLQPVARPLLNRSVTICTEGGAMAASWREQRFGELLALRSNDPALLVSMYCQLVGLCTSSQLPPGVSFMTMIDALLDAEALQRQSDASSDKSASG